MNVAENPSTDAIAELAIDESGMTLAEMAEQGRPTRDDDTVVIEGGRRATLEEVQAYIAADAASRSGG